MNLRRTTARIGVAAATAALVGGGLLGAAGAASAAPGVNCGGFQPTVSAGGLEGCDNEPANPAELNCYKGAAYGGAAGALTRDPRAAAAGAAVGCARGIIETP